MKLLSVVTVLLLVQCCKAQKTCTAETKDDVCKGPEYKAGVCSGAPLKCECATGWTGVTDDCNPTAPQISGVPTDVYVNESYTLLCNTTITGSEVTYAWFNGTKDLNKSTKTIDIATAQESNNGVYKCKITVAGKSAESPDVTVTFKTPGKSCADGSSCVGTDLKGYTGKCVSKICECADGYIKKQDKCQSGAASITASLLILVTVILTHLS